MVKMVCGCVRKGGEKKRKEETARVKDWEGAFFFFQEREMTDGKSGSDERRRKNEKGD